jgi:hypothetical protein
VYVLPLLYGIQKKISIDQFSSILYTSTQATIEILFENGKPYKGGTVQFRSEGMEDVTVLGDIKKDGSFQLRALNGKKRAEGGPGW